MIFKKKGGMIDVRELQRRGVVRIPKEEIKIPSEEKKEGFVNVGVFEDQISSGVATTNDNSRRQNERITELDNKIYRLENRIELLEKKLDVNQPSTTSSGSLIGW